MTFEEIRRLDAGLKTGAAFAGIRVPAFDEVLDYARGKIGIYVDVKATSAKDLVQHIVEHGMADGVVIYSGGLSKEIRQLNPRLKIMPEARSAGFARKLVDELHPEVIAFDASGFKPETIAVAKKGNALVYVDRLGTADTPAAWQEAIDLGADGIQSDRPEELVTFLRAGVTASAEDRMPVIRPRWRARSGSRPTPRGCRTRCTPTPRILNTEKRAAPVVPHGHLRAPRPAWRPQATAR
jgi:glycerophosphoryl diester phosphodiesterase